MHFCKPWMMHHINSLKYAVIQPTQEHCSLDKQKLFAIDLLGPQCQHFVWELKKATMTPAVCFTYFAQIAESCVKWSSIPPPGATSASELVCLCSSLEVGKVMRSFPIFVKNMCTFHLFNFFQEKQKHCTGNVMDLGKWHRHKNCAIHNRHNTTYIQISKNKTYVYNS